MSQSQPSAMGGATLMSLLCALPLPSPAALELVATQAPFTHSSSLPAGQLGKWLTRLSASVSSRDPAAAEIAALVIEQDTEGTAAAQCGKSWMGACLGTLSAPTTASDALPPFFQLVQALVAASPYAPAFEREVVQPSMGKLAVALSRLVERLGEAHDWSTLASVLDSTQEILSASPAAFRPAAPGMRAALNSIMLGAAGAPEPLVLAAAEMLAVLHLVNGKAAAPASWGADMRDALGGLAASLSALAADAWEEEPPRTQPPAPPASVPAFTADPLERCAVALAAVEGYTEAALALLRITSARPVPVPLSQIVSASLRCLNLTLDTPVAAHVSPQHHAALIAALPRVWTCGILLLATAVETCGDHLVPHLSAILEHSVYLLERVPATMAESRLQLLRVHSVLLGQYPAATLPLEYTTRLLKFSLALMGTQLEERPAAAITVPVGRKGKKRARGQEDALVGGLEGRAPRAISPLEAETVLAAVELTPRLHTAPLLPMPLLSFSLRLHVSLFLALRARPTAFVDAASRSALETAVERALEQAATLSCRGTARDIRTLLLSLLPPSQTSNFDLLLHPALPPLSRPTPPLSQLEIFAPMGDEERRLRRELGFDVGEKDEDSESDDDMAVDDWSVKAAPASVPAAVSSVPVPVPVPVPAPAPPPAAMPIPVAVPVAVPVPVATAAAPSPGDAPTAAPELSTSVEPHPAANVPFMSAPSGSAAPAPQPTAPAPAKAEAVADADDSDDEIPELDSGSSDGEDD